MSSQDGTLTQWIVLQKNYQKKVDRMRNYPLTIGNWDDYIEAKANLIQARAKVRALRGNQ